MEENKATAGSGAQLPVKVSKIILTSKLINEQPTAKALLELPAIAENWIDTYSKVSGKGKSEAVLRFEAEKILFLKQISGSSTLSKCDRFSQYTAFFELAISGGTLRDGMCYIVPFKGKAEFMPGWKFRLEQVNDLPDVIYCHEPVVVYDCDEFEHELGERPKIKTHVPKTRTKENRPTYVYWVIDFKHGTSVYIMDALKVLQIRDQYSASYKEYVKACADKKQDPTKGLPVMKDGQYGPYEVELPMWIKDESQAFQKTIVKQVWKHLPKLPKHKWLEQRQRAAGTETLDEDDAIIDYGNLLIKNDDEKQPDTGGNAGGAPVQQPQSSITDVDYDDGNSGGLQQGAADDSGGAVGSGSGQNVSPSLRDEAANTQEGW